MIIHTALYKKLVAKLPVTIPTQDGTLTYTGRTQSPSWSGFYDNLMTISGQTTGQNAGEYTVTFRLKDKQKYEWENGTVTDKQVTWSIGRAIIPRPYQTGTLTYTGNTLTPTWANYDPNKMTISTVENGNLSALSAIDAGTYYVRFETYDNYYFENPYDSTMPFGAIETYWKIEKASPNLTVNPTNITLNPNNTTQTITVNRLGDGEITATSSNTSIATVSVSENIVTVNKNDNTGDAEIIVSVSDVKNYHYEELSIPVSYKIVEFSLASLQTSNTDYLYDITYGNGKFVIISSNTALYSVDGISWVETNLPSTASWCSVTYGNGMFVTVASYGGNTVSYSTDGITWEETTLPSSMDLRSVTYGNGKFVAVGTEVICYSEDGINWIKEDITISFGSICYGDGKFLASELSSVYSPYIYRSDDGSNFYGIRLPGNYRFDNNSIGYGNGFFVLKNANGPSLLYVNSSTFEYGQTSLTGPVVAYGGRCAYGNGVFILATAIFYCSLDVINWDDIQTGFPNGCNFQKICYGGGRFVAIGYSSNSKEIAYSL